MTNGSLLRRIGYAVAGWRTVLRNEKRFRIQVVVALAASTALLTAPSAVWVAILLLTIGAVLSLECINAALEYLADAVHPELALGIGAAEDAAAGAVLIMSLVAVGVGVAFAYSVLS